MTYILEPLNEGQEMNCIVPIKSKKSVAIVKASCMAAALQTQLAGCTITVRVRRRVSLAASVTGWVVAPDGTVID
jgi:hypothetical protein